MLISDTDIFLLNIVCFSTYFGYNFSLLWVKGSIANCFLHVPPKYSREMINASSARYHVAQTCPPLSMAPPTLHFSKKFHSFIFQIYISDSTLSSSSISQCSSASTQIFMYISYVVQRGHGSVYGCECWLMRPGESDQW
jgi:hypothetical protein